jgi:hypothetical protein
MEYQKPKENIEPRPTNFSTELQMQRHWNIKSPRNTKLKWNRGGHISILNCSRNTAGASKALRIPGQNETQTVRCQHLKYNRNTTDIPKTLGIPG